MTPATRSTLQGVAIGFTVACAVLAVGTVWLAGTTGRQGATALWIMIPIIVMIGAHVFLGPVAIGCAIMTRRFWRNAWIFAYFLAIGPVMLIELRGGSPVEVFTAMVRERIEYHALTRANPDETALCEALARSLQETGGKRAPVQPIEVALSPGFVADYECWNRSVRPPRGLRRLLDRATLLEMAVVAGEAPVIASLIEAGADAGRSGRNGVTPLLLALSGAAPVSYEAGLERRRRMAELRPVIDLLVDAGADLTRGDLEGRTPLHWAAALGDVAQTARMLAAGADPEARIEHLDHPPAHAAVGAIELTILSTAPRTEPQAYYDEIVASYSEVLRRLAAAGAAIEASRMRDPRVETLLEEIRRTAR